MKIKAYALSDVGMRRERNEDSYLTNEDIGLFMVADGMGGHVGGEHASRAAVSTIDESVRGNLEGKDISELEDDAIFLTNFGDNEVRDQLRDAIQTASHKIFEEAKNDPRLRGMGTTCVVLLVRNGRVYIANVGDSRAYLVRNGKISQLTMDHSLVGEQLRAGVISQDAAKEHRLKNIITRSVGFQDEVEIDVMAKIPHEGDTFLLCSDGLTNMLEDSEILGVIAQNPPKESCQILIDTANTRGGDDNITVVLVKVEDVEGVEPPPEDDESTIGI